MKAPFIIYADLESLLEKMSTCYDSPEKLSATKIHKHTPSGYSLFTYCTYLHLMRQKISLVMTGVKIV